MTSPAPTIEIVGAGPAGLSAALTIARSGGRAVLDERHPDVGSRFHGDFQGLENWTTDGDVLEELASLGIEPTFEHTAFRECVFYDPEGREYVYRSPRPLWYLVRRGSFPGSLDHSLKAQALAAGVECRFGTLREHLPEGGIVAHGPHRVDAIGVGYTFETDRPDAAFGAVSEALAPKGYSYLLIARGRGTVADGRDWLHRYYASGRLKLLFLPFARWRLARKPELIVGCIEGCDCTWCRCGGHGGPVRRKPGAEEAC